MLFQIVRKFSDGSQTVFGSEDTLAKAIYLAERTKPPAGVRFRWMSDIIQNTRTGVTMVTKDERGSRNWRTDGTFLDIFIGALFIDSVWNSFWLQPDGTVIRIEERDLLRMRLVEELPNFRSIEANGFQPPICSTCGSNPADGISHDSDHRALMPPYAILECGLCAWDSPGSVYYEHGHHDVGRLKALAGEFFA